MIIDKYIYWLNRWWWY